MITQKIRNYIYYVSDMGTLPARGHFFKMDKEKEIAGHIKEGFKECAIIKSSDYDGRVIDADSVGIVFPAHSWGVSLAVKLFLENLSVKKGTYVYAVATGESVYATYGKESLNTGMDEFLRLFSGYGLGRKSDIYVRCENIKRSTGGTEEKIKYSSDKKKNLENIMNGLLCYNLEYISKGKVLSAYYSNAAFDEDNYEEFVAEEKRANDFNIRGISAGLRLSNVFLDEDMLAGVRLCQVM